jgi:hypothetical protein
MKAWSFAGILVMIVSPLLLSTPCRAWWVDHEVTDSDLYTDTSEGQHADGDYAGPLVSGPSWADAWSEIDYPEENAYGASHAYVYWTDWITDYDPESDPPLVAHLKSVVYSQAYALYELEGSDYYAVGAAWGYANGYSANAYVEIAEPQDGDISTDYFDEDLENITQNGPIYLRELAYAGAETWSTEDTVQAAAYGECETTCVVEESR